MRFRTALAALCALLLMAEGCLAFSDTADLLDKAEGVTVRGNAEYCARICSGLLENALKYEPVGGRVTLTLGTYYFLVCSDRTSKELLELRLDDRILVIRHFLLEILVSPLGHL